MRAASNESGRWVRRAVLVIASLAFMGVFMGVTAPTPAYAHAALVESSPVAGALLDEGPSEVRLEFDEEVEAGANALRVFDADGIRIDQGGVSPQTSTSISVSLPDDLDDGAYVVAYRVTSIDAHPIAGTLTFTVGDAAVLDESAVEEIAGLGSGWLGVLGSVLRGIGYVGSLLAAGTVAFLVAIRNRTGDRDAARRLARRAATVGIAASLLHIPFQAAALSGYDPLTATTDPTVISSVLTSTFGQGVALRVVGLGLLAILWHRHASRGVLAAVSALTLGSYLLDGHQRSVDPTWLLASADAIHLVAAATWLASLALVFLALRRHRAAEEPVAAADLVRRLSRIALWSVVALTAAGIVMALPLVRGLDALTSTAYGWTLLAKVGLVTAVIAVAAYNRRRLVPAVARHVVPAGASLDDASGQVRKRDGGHVDAWHTLRRAVGLELAILGGVLAITGFLVSTQPAAVAAGLSGPTFVTAPFGDDLELDLSIDPSTPGRNTLHVYVLEPSGQPSNRIDDLRWEFTYLPEQIGPIVVEPFVAGPGHWTATIDDLRFAGDWELRIVGSAGRFDEIDTTIPFSIND